MSFTKDPSSNLHIFSSKNVRGSLASLLICIPLLSAAATPTEERILKADATIARVLRDGLELQPRQSFLFSLKAPMPPATLDRLMAPFGLQVKSAHVCVDRGVIGIGIKDGETVEKQVYRTDFAEVMGLAPGTHIPTGGRYIDLKPDDIRLCGFEVRTSLHQLVRLRASLGTDVRCIELLERYRLLPINRWMADLGSRRSPLP